MVKVDIVAPSSVIPQIELARGQAILSSLGFEVRQGDNLAQQHFAFSGDDQARACAFIDAAFSDSDILWAARGGYGAAHLLPYLQALTGALPPPKLLVGYSDLTALYEFLTAHWGWRVLHGPMLCSDNFQQAGPRHRAALMELVKEGRDSTLTEQPLHWLHSIGKSISAPIMGGNLSVICSMIGTPWQLDLRHKMLFLEEIGESWSKIDRMIQQLLLSGALKECKAILLGQFSSCLDVSPKGLGNQSSAQKSDLRPCYSQCEAIALTLLPVARQLGIPLVSGLDVGHHSHSGALAINAGYHLEDRGSLTLVNWR